MKRSRKQQKGRKSFKQKVRTIRGKRVRTDGPISGDTNLHPGTCVVCGKAVRAKAGRLIRRRNGDLDVEHLWCSQKRRGRGMWGQASGSPMTPR